MKLRTTIKNIAGGVLLALPVSGLIAVPASAHSTQTTTTTTQSQCEAQSAGSITIPVDTVARGAAGSEQTLTTKAVDNGNYTAQVVAVNQGSVHPNSNIIVRSGSSQVEVADVESAAFQSKTADGTIVVANGEIDVVLQLGGDGVFSGGMNVILSKCTPSTPVTPVYSCDALQLGVDNDNRKVTVTSAKYTAKDGATYTKTVLDWGDKSQAVTATDVTGQSHTYDYGTYTVTATMHFTVNDKDVTDTCSQKVTFTKPNTPPTTPPTTTTPPAQLPNTGAGNVVALGGAAIVLGYVVNLLRTKRAQR